MKRYILILICILSIPACSKDELAKSKTLKADKVIFGAVYGMCSGDCRELFLINSQELFKDADNESDEYGEWSQTTFQEKMDQEQFSNAREILEVPSSLIHQDISVEDLVQSYSDIDYYLYIEKDGKSQELILDHIHRNSSPEVKAYFQVFLKSYKELGGFILDTTNVERYY